MADAVTLDFHEGWNIIPVAIDPDVKEIDKAFDPIMDKIIVIREYTDSGTKVYDPGIPLRFNTLKQIEYGKAYQIKMKDKAELLLTGSFSFDQDKTISLHKGWNCFPYLGSKPKSIDQSIELIKDNVIVIRDFASTGTKVYDPGVPLRFNTLKDFYSDKAYMIKMSDSGKLDFTEEPGCIDTDNGKNYYVKGECADTFGGSMGDGCITGGEHDGWLREIVCDDRGNGLRCQMNDYKCPYNCLDGICTGELPELEQENISILSSGGSRYILTFLDANNNQVNLPIGVVNSNNYYLGDSYSSTPASARYTIMDENSIIKKNDYFVLTDVWENKSYVMQYKGADKYRTDDTTPPISFTDVGSGDNIDVTYSREKDIYLKFGKSQFLIKTASPDTSNDFDLNIDLDGSGKIGNIIEKNDMFYLRSKSGQKHHMQYKGADKYTSDTTTPPIMFKDVGNGYTFEATYKRGQDVYLKYYNEEYKIELAGKDTMNDFPITIDYDASGEIGDDLIVPIHTYSGAMIEFSASDPGRGNVLENGFGVKISSLVYGDFYSKRIKPHDIIYQLSASGSGDKITMTRNKGLYVNHENSYGMTSYGTKVRFYQPTKGIPELHVKHPFEQRLPQVFISSGKDSWLIQTRYENLYLSNSQSTATPEDTIRDVVPRIDESRGISSSELYSLSYKTFVAQPYSQKLFFDNSDTGFVQFIEYSDTDVQTDHFIIPNGKQIARYKLEFETHVESIVTDKEGNKDKDGTYLPEFTNRDINLLGKEYTVVSARRNGGYIQGAVKLLLIGGAVKETLNQGETGLLKVDDIPYEVELTYVDSSDRAAFKINGEQTGKINVGDTYKLGKESGYLKIGLLDTKYEAKEDGIKRATFILGADDLTLWDTNIEDEESSKNLYIDGTANNIDGAKVIIKGSDNNEIVKLKSIEVDMYAGDDYYVAPGESLSKVIEARLDEPEVLFTENWDIDYTGLSGGVEEPAVEECVDSDGGDDIYTKGFRINNNPQYESYERQEWDYCIFDPDMYDSDNIINDEDKKVTFCQGEKCYIIEYHCQEDLSDAHSGFQCPHGCQDGACLRQECDEFQILNPDTGKCIEVIVDVVGILNQEDDELVIVGETLPLEVRIELEELLETYEQKAAEFGVFGEVKYGKELTTIEKTLEAPHEDKYYLTKYYGHREEEQKLTKDVLEEHVGMEMKIRGYNVNTSDTKLLRPFDYVLYGVVGECRDSDGGYNIYEKGTVINYGPEDQTFTDACLYGEHGYTGIYESVLEKYPILLEYDCKGSYSVNVEEFTGQEPGCTYGCFNGRCLQKEYTMSCEDPDSSKRYDGRATTVVSTIKETGEQDMQTDRCNDKHSVIEFSCRDNGYIGSDTHTCDYMCKNGVCIDKPVKLEAISVDNWGYSNYILTFQDANNNKVKLPVGVVDSNTYYLGEKYSSTVASARYTILNEDIPLYKNDYFVLTDIDNKQSYAMQYKGADKYTSDDTTPPIRFIYVPTGEGIEVTYNRDEDIYLKTSGKRFKIEAASPDTSNDFKIKVDFDASGTIGHVINKNDIFYLRFIFMDDYSMYYKIHRMQYKGSDKYMSDNTNPIMTFRDLDTDEDIEVTYKRDEDIYLEYGSDRFRIELAGEDTMDDFPIRINYHRFGKVGYDLFVPIITYSGAVIELQTLQTKRDHIFKDGLNIKLFSPGKDITHIKYDLHAHGSKDKINLEFVDGLIPYPTEEDPLIKIAKDYQTGVTVTENRHSIPTFNITYPFEGFSWATADIGIISHGVDQEETLKIEVKNNMELGIILDKVDLDYIFRCKSIDLMPGESTTCEGYVPCDETGRYSLDVSVVYEHPMERGTYHYYSGEIDPSTNWFYQLEGECI